MLLSHHMLSENLCVLCQLGDEGGLGAGLKGPGALRVGACTDAVECEEASVELSDVAAVAGKAIEGVPGHAEPTGGVQAGAVEGQQLRAAASCQLLYPVCEGLTLMG